MRKALQTILALFVLTASSTPIVAEAQDELLEIVVTGSRIGGYDLDTTPVVHIRKRPDFMVINAYVESDSRDADTRRREIDRTLASVAKRAATTQHIELGLSRMFETDRDEIEYVIDFNVDDVRMTRGTRPDTSRVGLVIKSPILESDETPDAVYERIESFIESVDVSGRAIVKDTGDINFSLIGIEQYREPLLKMIAEDNARLIAIFGDAYTVSIGGLESPVRWRQAGPMTLTIYFPYSSGLMVD